MKPVKKAEDVANDGQHFNTDITIDWSELEPAVREELAATYEDSGKVIANALDSPFNQVNESAASYAENRAGSLITDIEKSTLDKIRAAEARAFREGMSPTEFADVVNDIIDDPVRAANIAKTEISTAQMTSAYDAAEASELVKGKRVLLSDDHDVRDTCDDAAEEGVIPLTQLFRNGSLMPPFHPGGCQCDAAFIVE